MFYNSRICKIVNLFYGCSEKRCVVKMGEMSIWDFTKLRQRRDSASASAEGRCRDSRFGPYLLTIIVTIFFVSLLHRFHPGLMPVVDAAGFRAHLQFDLDVCARIRICTLDNNYKTFDCESTWTAGCPAATETGAFLGWLNIAPCSIANFDDLIVARLPLGQWDSYLELLVCCIQITFNWPGHYYKCF
jgi:hypothetical protein